MSDGKTKIVDFATYCSTCKHYEVCEIDDPCNECLTSPVNADSHKPVKWEDNPEEKD